MDRTAKIYIAGHRGLVGSAIVRKLREKGFRPQSSALSPGLILRTHAELDLTNQQAVREFFEQEKPEYVFLAAAKVGGIHANNTYPAEFIRDNLAIQTNVIHEAYRTGVKRLLFLGSSCIYPRDCPQPMKEDTSSPARWNPPAAIGPRAGLLQHDNPTPASHPPVGAAPSPRSARINYAIGPISHRNRPEGGPPTTRQPRTGISSPL